MKKIISLLIIICSLFTLCACDAETIKLAVDSFEQIGGIVAQGDTYKYENCTLVIRDNADLMTDEEEKYIVDVLDSYCSQSKCDILIMTTKEVGLSSLSPGATYAKAYLPKNTENWIALTFDVARNSYYLYYDGEIATSAANGSRGDNILSEGGSYFNREQYADGMLAMAKASLDNVIKVQNK